MRNLNEHPLETVFLAWPLQDTRTIEPHRLRWTLGLSYSNILKKDMTVGAVDTVNEVYVDAEPLRLDFSTTYGFSPGWDAQVQISLFRYSGGFLDGFIRAFEQRIGAIRRDPSAPSDQFKFFIRRRGQTVIDRSGVLGGFGDTRIIVRRELRGTDRWSAAAVGAVKIPTGEDGLGSGGFDVGGGLAVLYVGERWRTRAELDGVLLSDFQKIDAHNRIDFKLGVEYARRRFSLYVQTDLRSRAITWSKGTLDELPMQIALGAKFTRPAGFLHQVYLVEDLSRVSPDVTFGYAVEF